MVPLPGGCAWQDAALLKHERARPARIVVQSSIVFCGDFAGLGGSRFGATALSMWRRSESRKAGLGGSRFGAAALSMRRRSEPFFRRLPHRDSWKVATKDRGTVPQRKRQGKEWSPPLVKGVSQGAGSPTAQVLPTKLGWARGLYVRARSPSVLLTTADSCPCSSALPSGAEAPRGSDGASAANSRETGLCGPRVASRSRVREVRLAGRAGWRRGRHHVGPHAPPSLARPRPRPPPAPPSARRPRRQRRQMPTRGSLLRPLKLQTTTGRSRRSAAGCSWSSSLRTRAPGRPRSCPYPRRATGRCPRATASRPGTGDGTRPRPVTLKPTQGA
eukprot:COSAG04_NODE_650_length_11561_cov_9.523731_2_plen_331_part_00